MKQKENVKEKMILITRFVIHFPKWSWIRNEQFLVKDTMYNTIETDTLAKIWQTSQCYFRILKKENWDNINILRKNKSDK